MKLHRVMVTYSRSSHTLKSGLTNHSGYGVDTKVRMNLRQRKKIVLLGMMSRLPVAGVVWQTLHYLVGFQRLGYDVYYVEAHARTPSMLMQHEEDDSSALAASF